VKIRLFLGERNGGVSAKGVHRLSFDMRRPMVAFVVFADGFGSLYGLQSRRLLSTSDSLLEDLMVSRDEATKLACTQLRFQRVKLCQPDRLSISNLISSDRGCGDGLRSCRPIVKQHCKPSQLPAVEIRHAPRRISPNYTNLTLTR
jgi:hypothetical protein